MACTSEVTLEAESKCTPIHGYMTAWVTVEQIRLLRQLGHPATTVEEHEEVLLDIVQSYIMQSQTAYLNDNLLHVAYMEPRDLKLNIIDPEVLVRPINPVNSGGDSSSRAKALHVGLGVAGAFFAVCVAGMAVVHRRRRQRRQGRTREMNEPDLDMEGQVIEDGPFGAVSPQYKPSYDDSEDDGSADGAFPTVANMDSMMASDGGSMHGSPQGEDDASQASSLPPAKDEDIPTSNLFGLRPGIMSDDVFDQAAVQSPSSTGKYLNDSLIAPLSPVNKTFEEDDESRADSAATPQDDDEFVADSNLIGIPTPGDQSDATRFVGDIAVSPSESTIVASGSAKIDDSAPMLVEDVSTDFDDDIEAQASHPSTDSVPRLV